MSAAGLDAGLARPAQRLPNHGKRSFDRLAIPAAAVLRTPAAQNSS
jgi:hypothetical protein